MSSSIRRNLARVAFLAALFHLVATACDPTAPEDPNDKNNLVPGVSLTTSVSSLTASAVSWREIDLSWPTSPSVSAYQIFRSTTGASGAYTQISTVSTITSRYGDVGLMGSTQYCYEVRSFKYTGKTISYSAFSSPACATTLPPPISPPSEIEAIPQGYTILVKWRDNSNNEDGFRVEGPEGSVTVPANTTSTYYGGYNLTEQPSCFRIYAFNAEASIPSITTDCTTMLAAPTNLSATALSAQSITLTWTDNSAFEDGYKVYRSGNNAGFTEIATLPPNTVTYRDVGVQADVSYAYHVQAVKDGGYSDKSLDAIGVIPTTVPAAPSNTEAAYSYDVISEYPPYPFLATIHIYWSDNSTNEAGFRIETSADGVSGWLPYRNIAANASHFEETFQSGGNEGGCFRVIAFNGLGDSSPSNAYCPLVYSPY